MTTEALVWMYRTKTDEVHLNYDFDRNAFVVRQDGKLLLEVPAIIMFDALQNHLPPHSSNQAIARRYNILHGTQPASSTLPRQ